MENVITLYRSRVVVAAIPLPDGQVLVIDEGREATVPAERFAERFAPATLEDMRAAAIRNGNHVPAAIAPLAPLPKRLGAGKKPGPRPTAKQIAVAKAERKNGKDWALGRKLWEQDVPTAEIAKRLGVSGAGVLYQARTKKWPKRETVWGSKERASKNPKPAAPSITSSAETAPPSPPTGRAKPAPIAVPRTPAPAKETKGKTPLRRCDTCGGVTEKDPCHQCGRPMQVWKGVFER